MVASEDEHGCALRAWHLGIPDQAELNGKILKPSQRAQWLCLAVNTGTEHRLEGPIDRFDQLFV